LLKQDLLEQIEQKRAELIQAATVHGLCSTLVIKFSQELDDLLNEYNRIYIKKLPLY
jgi:stage 0 sporulation regulatory protein